MNRHLKALDIDIESFACRLMLGSEDPNSMRVLRLFVEHALA